MVEVWRFELQASSTLCKKNEFFDYQTLHIVRIFRENPHFCTLYPMLPCGKIFVVVSYVVKPQRRVENGKWRVLENLLSL